MDNELKLKLALTKIKSILDNDKDYQSDSLKLGGIWFECINVLDYKYSPESNHVEVIHK